MKTVTFPIGEDLIEGNLIIEGKGTIGVLLLHGGTGNKEQYIHLQKVLSSQGFSSLAIDFRGIGGNSKNFLGQSLASRLQDAQVAFDFLSRYCTQIIVIGSSMGGHTAVELTEKRQIEKLILLYPAAYSQKAEHIVFGSEFSRILRTPHSYKDSIVFNALEKYTGSTLVIYGEHESIIPPEVQERYKKAINKGKMIIIPGASHGMINGKNELLVEEVINFIINKQ